MPPSAVARRDIARLALAAVCWGLGTVLSKRALDEIAPLALLAISGALYYTGACWFYLGALRLVPASIAGTSFYLIPIVGLAAGALLLGERLDPSPWLGAAIVMAAVVGIARQPARREVVWVEAASSTQT